MLVTKNDATSGNLETAVYDPGAGTLPDGVVFLGWTKDQNYDATATGFSAMTIEEIRADIEEVLNGDFEDYEAGGTPVTYYAVLIK